MSYEKKLIEGNFPCQEVGAETKRERGASSALPPLYFLHVWWARRPLTPSRAAVLGSILPADTNPNVFLKDLGIVKKQAVIGDNRWTLVGKNLDLIEKDGDKEYIPFSKKFQRAFDKENNRRNSLLKKLNQVIEKDSSIANNKIIQEWINENQPLSNDGIMMKHSIEVINVPANPSKINERISLKDSAQFQNIVGDPFSIDSEDMYGYSRAYAQDIHMNFNDITVLDPTAGGGSIPFEAMRLGCNVIANDLNPVATAIEKATLDYPAKYGIDLITDIERYANRLQNIVSEKLEPYFSSIKPKELIGDYLYYREVTCPHCGERVPLLNAFALSKKKDGWMVIPKIEEVKDHKKIRLIPVRLHNGKGPNGENPEEGTVKSGVGRCLCCGQAIDSEEIKRQARGESEYGTWKDRLYCVVGVRMQPKKDKDGNIMRYASGEHKGEVRTEKVTFFREPNEADYQALQAAEKKLKENWDRWEDMDLIPTEKIPSGQKTVELLRVGIERWCDMFTPRQLLAHLTAMETLHEMMPVIQQDLGEERGKAVIHYLQYIIDKNIDYNSRQTLWHAKRGVLAHTFTRHDFSLKWTFGELTYIGPNSGLSWGKEQVLDAYKGICELIEGSHVNLPIIINGSAANMDIPDDSVDIICVDPPYYNNVQYAELSDYFYVWEKRTFEKVYPDVFSRRLTNKSDEAVANPIRDGSTKEAEHEYEQRMSEIFAECRRILKDNGVMTMMFTHKTQEAWETLTRALIENGWSISSAFPVESESKTGIHQKDLAAAASSIFLACRKRDIAEHEPSIWAGFGGTSVRQKIRQAVEKSLRDFSVLHLNAVDEMVASYGSALKVLSENWPVMDGDAMVSPIQAMREASAVVAQYQLKGITSGRLTVNDLEPEASIALTMLGIYGTGYFAYDDALSLSKSLNIRLENKTGGYHDDGEMIGINDERKGRHQRDDEEEGYYAPLVKKGSKLRLVLPEERNVRRLENPQQEWDIMQGMLMAYRAGDIPAARDYLQKHATGKEIRILDVLRVWADNCGSEELKKEAQRLIFSLNA